MTDGMDRAPRVQEPGYFGGCPFCGGSRGYLNIGPQQWFFCEEHSTKWLVEENLFSSWKEESEEDWQRHTAQLEHYAEVEPLMPSWCQPVSREELDEQARRDGWVPDGPGGWRSPRYVNEDGELTF